MKKLLDLLKKLGNALLSLVGMGQKDISDEQLQFMVSTLSDDMHDSDESGYPVAPELVSIPKAALDAINKERVDMHVKLSKKKNGSKKSKQKPSKKSGKKTSASSKKSVKKSRK